MSKCDSILTQDRLKELLRYNPETGIFNWIVNRGRCAKVGYVSGNLDNGGYIRIIIDGKKYQAHRLAWLYMHGQFSQEQIDHINRVRNDNRACNLRAANSCENMQNKSVYKSNKSGHSGVCWCNSRNKWLAQIRVNGIRKHLGYFTEITDAIAVREKATINLHPRSFISPSL